MELRETLVECINNGLTLQQISDQTGIGCIPKIKRRINAFGLVRQDQKRKYHFNQDFFELIDTEEKAYWLGFLAADGNIHIQKNTYSRSYIVTLGLAEKDLKHVEKFREALNAEYPISKNYNKNFNTYSYKIRLNSKKMFDDLVDKGITERKSLTLKPPINVPQELIRHWIRGYFDGDGCISFIKKNGNILFKILGTKEVLQFILDKSDLILNTIKRGNIYIIRSSGVKALKLLNYIYNDSTIYLDRKFKRWYHYN